MNVDTYAVEEIVKKYRFKVAICMTVAIFIQYLYNDVSKNTYSTYCLNSFRINLRILLTKILMRYHCFDHSH